MKKATDDFTVFDGVGLYLDICCWRRCRICSNVAPGQGVNAGGQPFPYYSPPLLRGLDVLKEADCLYSIEYLRIQYVKTRFCPLMIPSVCPECKCKFFEMTGDEQPTM